MYALKTSDLVVTADNMNYKSLLSEFEAIAEAKGTLISTTGADGTVTGELSETGRFMLVATKDGFVPGFTRLTVSLAVKKALNLKAHGFIEINKAVTISVTERFSQQPAAGVTVYARLVTDNDTLPLGKAPVTKPVQTSSNVQMKFRGQVQTQARIHEAVKTTKLKAPANSFAHVQNRPFLWTADNATVIKYDPWDETTSTNCAAEIQSGGFLLGNTDANGQLTCTFTEKGTYVLTATKDSYIPSFAKISMHTANQVKINIKAPVTSLPTTSNKAQ